MAGSLRAMSLCAYAKARLYVLSVGIGPKCIFSFDHNIKQQYKIFEMRLYYELVRGQEWAKGVQPAYAPEESSISQLKM